MTSFEEALTLLVAIPDEAMARPWTWRTGGPQQTIRGGLYRSLDDEQGAAVAVAPVIEAGATLSLAQRAFGDLRGLLVGLEDQVIDAIPAVDEWSIRQTLNHMIVTEVRYAAQVAWALSRGESDPIRIPDGQLPSPTLSATGSIDGMLAQLALARSDTDDRFVGVSLHELQRPTVWGGFEVDVRFRLHRFAGHIIEHTIQCEKTLAELATFRETEARRIVRRISATRGVHEHISSPSVVTALDKTLLSRARQLAEIADVPVP